MPEMLGEKAEENVTYKVVLKNENGSQGAIFTVVADQVELAGGENEDRYYMFYRMPKTKTDSSITVAAVPADRLLYLVVES